MKKLLALLLLSPFVAGEEVEYPIELTCELGATMMYVYIAEDISDSWIKHLEKSPLTLEEKKRKGRISTKFKTLEFDKDTLKIRFKDMGFPYHKLYINRYTLLAESEYPINVYRSGKCFKGFKEYNKKQI